MRRTPLTARLLSLPLAALLFPSMSAGTWPRALCGTSWRSSAWTLSSSGSCSQLEACPSGPGLMRCFHRSQNSTRLEHECQATLAGRAFSSRRASSHGPLQGACVGKESMSHPVLSAGRWRLRGTHAADTISGGAVSRNGHCRSAAGGSGFYSSPIGMPSRRGHDVSGGIVLAHH